jgi:hypothetical protein
VLGFDRGRDHVGENRRIKELENKKLDGVPSEATVSRHRRQWFVEAECFLRMVEEHAEKFPEFRKELRVIGFDGSVHKTVYRPGRKRDQEGNITVDPDTGEILERSCGWEGGIRTSLDIPESKRGHGFLTVTGHTAQAMPSSSGPRSCTALRLSACSTPRSTTFPVSARAWSPTTRAFAR